MSLDTKQLQKEIARLEFINDQLSMELSYVDELLRVVGFPEGLQTIKTVVQEVISEDDFLD